MTTRGEERHQAYQILGVDPNVVASSPKISHFLHKFPGGRSAAIQYLRAYDAPEARAFMSFYGNLLYPSFVRKLLPIEAFSIAAGVNPMRLWGVICEAHRYYKTTLGSAAAAERHIDVIEASIDAATTPEGIEDRTMQLKHLGFLPLPKGSQVNVQVNASAQSLSASAAESKSIALPPAPEDTIRRLQNRFNETREAPALPAAPTLEAIPAVMPRTLEAMPVHSHSHPSVDSDYDAMADADSASYDLDDGG